MPCERSSTSYRSLENWPFSCNAGIDMMTLRKRSSETIRLRFAASVISTR